MSHTTTMPTKLVLGVGGSIAALTLPTYLAELRLSGVERVAAILTASARTMVAETAMRHICDACYTDDDPGPGHVAVARWATGFLLLPATAHMIACLAHGLAPSYLTTTLVAYPGRVTVVPGMNADMWASKSVQRNVRQLRDDGHVVVDPVPGAAYEVASRTIQETLVMPPAAAVVAALAATTTTPATSTAATSTAASTTAAAAAEAGMR